MAERTKFILDEDRIPRSFYNIAADLREPPAPVMHPGTGQPIGPADLAPLFPMELIKQVVSADREIEIPDPVREAYALYRPSPLFRAHRAREGPRTRQRTSTTSTRAPARPAATSRTRPSRRLSTLSQEGVKRFATETGAGQWGSALAFAGSLFGIEVKVYMVRASYDQKPYRRNLMEVYGARGRRRARARTTEYGRRVLADTPDHPGSLGIAISEAIEDTSPSGHQVLARIGVRLRASAPDGDRPGGDRADGDGRRGARRDHRLRRGRIELRRAGLPVRRSQAARRGELPRDCRRAGGGAVDDAGPLRLRLRRHRPDDAAGQDAHPGPRLRAAADPRRRPALPRHGAAGQPAPRAGPDRGARRSSAGDVRGRRDQFARTEGILPAPESNHAIRAAIDEALEAREEGRPRVILFNLSGHGHFDLSAYAAYLQRPRSRTTSTSRRERSEMVAA